MRSFGDKYPTVPLGIMYGMTEVGVIATDLNGEHRPALAPAPGMVLPYHIWAKSWRSSGVGCSAMTSMMSSGGPNAESTK